MTEPDPDVARLAAIDRELTSLVDQMEAARTQYVQATQLWYTRRADRDQLARLIAQRPPTDATARPASAGAAPDRPGPAAPSRSPADVSGHTVQNLLFVVGGLLVVVAAIAFRVFAWASVGAAGRAVVLALLTIAMLAVPFVARRRGLHASAETFGIVGLALLLVDGVGAHSMNLLGVGRFGLTHYLGWLCAGVALVAVGYGVAARLYGSRYVALALYLPVFSLLLGGGSPARWSLVCSLTALGLLAVEYAAGPDQAGPGRAPEAGTNKPRADGEPDDSEVAGGESGQRRVLPWWRGLADRPLAVVALSLAAMVTAIAVLATADVARPLAPLAMAVAAVLTAACGHRAIGLAPSQNWLRTAAGTLATIEVAVAVAAGLHRYASAPLLVAYPAVALAVAAGATLLPERTWPRLGPRIGAAIYSGATALTCVFMLLVAASVYLIRVAPYWHTALSGFAADIQVYDWTLPVGLACVAGAIAILTGRMAPIPLASGLVAVAVALPGSVPLAWWAPPVVDGLVLVAFLLIIVFVRDRVARAAAAVANGVVGLHALLAALIRPGTTGATLAAFAVLGVTHAAIGIRRGRVSQIIGGAGLAIALVCVPGAAVSFASVAHPVTVVLRVAAVSAAAVLAATVAVGRWWRPLRWYALAAVTFVAVVLGASAPYASISDPAILYAAGAMLAIALAPLCVRITGWPAMLTASAGALLVPAVAVRAVPSAATVLFLPYEWLAHTWTGRPRGVGLAAVHGWHLDYVDVATLALITLSIGVLGPLRRALPVPAVVTVLVAFVAAGVPWPWVPMVSLVLGLSATLGAALGRPPVWSRTFGQRANLAVAGMLATGAGLAGTLPLKATTLAAVGLSLVAFAAIGAAGRGTGVRARGWVRTAAALAALAYVAARAAGIGNSMAAFAVLGGAAAVLVGSAVLYDRRRVESAALLAAAHAAALVAVILAGGAWRSALVCALWGVVVGGRALWPGLPARPRFVQTSAAIGLELVAWWLLLGLSPRPVDWYTLPAALTLLAIGWIAVRYRPGLRSWPAYGPALVAAFLPSSVPLLGAEASVTRRLALGGAALAVLIAGSLLRMQAPTVIGAVIVVLVALHELVLLWQMIPAWIPLSVAGLLVLAIAMTYERRRRDVVRLRSYVGRMS